MHNMFKEREIKIPLEPFIPDFHNRTFVKYPDDFWALFTEFPDALMGMNVAKEAGL